MKLLLIGRIWHWPVRISWPRRVCWRWDGACGARRRWATPAMLSTSSMCWSGPASSPSTPAPTWRRRNRRLCGTWFACDDFRAGRSAAPVDHNPIQWNSLASFVQVAKWKFNSLSLGQFFIQFWSKFGKCMNLSKFGFKRSKIVKMCANKMKNWSHHPKLSTILKFRP